MALADAIRMNEPGNQYLVVSLGTGSYEEPIRYQKARRRGLFGWAPGILDVMFDGVNGDELERIDDQKVRRALRLLREDLEKEVVVGETKKYADDKLDNYDPKNIKTLQKLTDEMLKENQSDFNDLLRRLGRSDGSIGYERAGNGVKTFEANA